MESVAVLNLIDSFWFEHNIFNKTSTSSISIPTSSSENVDHKKQEESSSELKPARIQINHTRCNSDQSLTSLKDGYYPVSPVSVLPFQKLQTILSGKEVTDSEPEKDVLLSAPPKKKKFTRRKRSGSKSLSDLEFEELKGFMDLGFVFTEEDKDSSLASIIPGLHRLGKKNEEVEDSNDFESLVPRPYLSEAWEVIDERKKKENHLMNWKVPSINIETDMKDSLRLWAHTVASTVR
ncbi:hypothetical protein TanjilG_20372 [Lupinus angustifolius]|uniref:DUF1685 family protein n=1 Tax=Lupinus angustifolius TaxID=3871 RepID=A0A4P1RVW9_LUPAN|nr:PREDICTED: uncharacterized protein LOC109348713 [Lupinus angustifolius]OIW19247.1 hypothetical protein TanjilG_20372 [Lupinus angustifolius]